VKGFNPLKRYPFHTFLFAIYPVLALLANNLTEVEPAVALRPLVISIILAALILALALIPLKNWRKAGVVATFLLVLFYSYGHLYNLLRDNPLLGVNLGRHTILGTIYIVLLSIGLFLSIRVLRDFSAATQLLNWVGILLLLFPIFQISQSILQETDEPSNQLSASEQHLSPEWSKWLDESLSSNPLKIADGHQPDIYYIILDMYARHDAILDDVHYDNTAFLNQLREMGFYVANCSRSNYAQTRLSLVSSLNLDYLENVGEGIEDEDMLDEPLDYSLARSKLENLGYQTIVFGSGFGLPEISGSARVFSPPQPPRFLMQIQPFEVLLINSTAVRIVVDIRINAFNRIIDTIMFPYNDHATIQRYILNKLKDIPSIQGPKFVFVHLMVPHPPFIFTPDGSLIKDDLYYREDMGLPSTEELFQKGYANQVAFLDNRLPELLQAIITQSKTPPIIVLQGDHGIRSENRMQILNAYYLPDNGADQLYESISPVNSFRYIFNHYFGTNYPLLEDKSYYSEPPDRFDLTLVEETSSSCLNTIK